MAKSALTGNFSNLIASIIARCASVLSLEEINIYSFRVPGKIRITRIIQMSFVIEIGNAEDFCAVTSLKEIST